MPKRIPPEVEKRAIHLYERDRLSIAKVQAMLASEGVKVGTNWIYRAIRRHGVARTHSQAMEFAMNVRRMSCTCSNCQKLFLGRQINEKYCETCAPTSQAYKRLYLYQMSEAEFQERLRQQEHTCLICERNFDDITPLKSRRSSVVVDYAHESGRVRGLLCHECNVTVGYIEKHPRETLDKVLAYLTTGVSSCTER